MKQKGGEIAESLRHALDLRSNYPVILCAVTERQNHRTYRVVEVGGTKRKFLLRQNAVLVESSDVGFNQIERPEKGPQINSFIIVVPYAEAPWCERISFWGKFEDLVCQEDFCEVEETEVLHVVEDTDPVSDTRTTLRLRQTPDRRYRPRARVHATG
jgi:hypothetical protein